MLAGTGNTNPRRAYLQKPDVELTTEGSAWLNQRLEDTFSSAGMLPPAALNQLDWPQSV